MAMVKLPSSAKITDLSFEIDQNDVNDISEVIRAANYETLELNGHEYFVLEMNCNPPEQINTDGLLIKPKRIMTIDFKLRRKG
ncbi:hypothetical protein TW1_062 [Pseudoalteromonas phage TW1]|uniref:hypothetical protein n=1 Tax=Pseudoalteromonas phage TW1 TaxID=1366055 RepID=UPI00035AB45C|nr:hypothetical protein PP585_gp62 [Pseudoalteromonas phage TW1]AGR46578.1 hypothetical protein TW1_062 [Pseudoalteromonas phage TW1]